MNVEYCCKECVKGRAAKDIFLKLRESVFDAASDFDLFVEDCYKNCPYKDKHTNEEN